MSRVRIWSIPGPRSGEVSAHLSIASSREDHVGGSTPAGPSSIRAVYAARASTWHLAEMNGRLLVHICQMTSARLRATSTRATVLPRCLGLPRFDGHVC
jgi:hypothetical protein